MTTPALVLRDLHAAAEAVFADGPFSLPAWYGRDESDAVAAEYAAARETAAVVDLAERAVLEVGGPQRQKFLHNILSNELLSGEPGHGCLAALMDVKGHLVALMRALVTQDAVRLELPAVRLAVVEATLLHYKVGAPVRFAQRPTVILGVLGPGARDLLARLGAAPPDLPAEGHVTASLAGGEARVARASDLPGGAFVVHVAPDAAGAAWTELLQAGARPLGRRALDARRVEAGRPWFGPDIDESNLLHETGLLREYHSSTKGCYIGQEVIARLEARGGHVNKALRGLRLTAPASVGSAVTVAGEAIGRVTTAALSPRLGPIAMAWVHRNHFAAGTPVEVEGHPAAVTALPLEP